MWRYVRGCHGSECDTRQAAAPFEGVHDQGPFVPYQGLYGEGTGHPPQGQQVR